MKRKRFTEEQIIGVLKEHELGAKTSDVWPPARRVSKRDLVYVADAGASGA